jgi:divalent metal cation (Fe/Co/Zn/Cd) transporter
VEVETHIEPMQADGMAGHDADAGRVREVQAALTQIAAETGAIRDIHEVRVRETDAGEIVNFHCHADAELTVQAVHENVDAVERALRQRLPEITRVVGHAEPKV